MAVTNHPQCFASTHQGRKRAHNEDNYLADPDLRVFAVADGMGGHQAGEVASAIAVRTVHEVLQNSRGMLTPMEVAGPRSEVSRREVLGLLEWAVQEASRRIHAEAQKDEGKRGMGTTLSVMVLLDAHAYVAHVGDSRIYLVRGSRVDQVTEDHTIGNELVRLGVVTWDQLPNVPRRNAITRAVGIYEHVEVDTLTLEVLPRDQFILASDGLTGYLDSGREDLSKWTAEEDGEKVVQGLINFANERGGKDNITSLLVRLGGGDVRDSARAKRLELKREMLHTMPLFSRLAERELLQVMQVAEVFEYAPGEVVIQQGEAGDRMYVCLDGRLQVVSHNTPVGELKRGEHFGEMALVRNLPRSATIKAIVPSELISIKREDFFELIRSEPRVAVKLLWQFLGVLAHRLERTSNDLSYAREAVVGTRQQWIEDEPTLDPFAQPPASSYYPRPATIPGLDDDAAVTPRKGSMLDNSPHDQIAPTDQARPLSETGPHRPEGYPRLEYGNETDPGASLGGQAHQSQPGLDANQGDQAGVSLTGGPSADDFDAKKTVPALRRPSVRRPRAHTLKSAAEDGVSSDPKATRPDRPLQPGDEEFRPTKETLPLEQPGGLEEELAELRREFKERLAKARRDRKKRGG